MRFYRAFAERDCIPTDLLVTGAPALPRHPERTADIADFIGEQDIIYVGGGNTANMLAPCGGCTAVDLALRAA